MTEQNDSVKTEVKLPTAAELLEAGAHFGHRASAWHPKMKPYIFTSRNNVHIFDLEKPIKKLGEALEFMKQTVAQGGVIIFVGVKPAAKALIGDVAQKLGMPYVNLRWLGGTITNFKTIAKRINYYRDLERQQAAGEWEKYTKKEKLELQRKLAKLDRQLSGIRDLNKLPQAVFISDVKEDNIAVREAKIAGIPVVAITDTNIDPTGIDYIIPANDDAVSSIKKILDIVFENLKDIKVEVKAEVKAGEEAK